MVVQFQLQNFVLFGNLNSSLIMLCIAINKISTSLETHKIHYTTGIISICLCLFFSFRLSNRLFASRYGNSSSTTNTGEDNVPKLPSFVASQNAYFFETVNKSVTDRHESPAETHDIEERKTCGLVTTNITDNDERRAESHQAEVSSFP